jgi:hypothetical protein
MIKNRILIRNTLVFGIIILLFGIAVQPGTATVQIYRDHEEKLDFLFQTIVEISNDKEFKNLINREMKNGCFLDFNYDFKNVYRNILFDNPSLLSSLFLTKNSLTQNNLESAYEKGRVIINEVGEDTALDLFESIKINNPRISNGLSDIFNDNEKIKSRISEIKLMNQELNPTLPFDGNPLICAILLMLTFTYAIPMVSIFVILLTLSTWPILGPFFVALLALFTANLALFITLVKEFC